MKSWHNLSRTPVETPGLTCGTTMSRVSAANRPAVRIPAKSSGACIVMRLESAPPSITLLRLGLFRPVHDFAGRRTAVPFYLQASSAAYSFATCATASPGARPTLQPTGDEYASAD